MWADMVAVGESVLFSTWEENSMAENSDVLSQRCKEDMVLVEEDAKVEAHSGMSERRRP